MGEISSSMRALTEEQARAQDLAANLTGLAWAERRERVASESRYWRPAFVELAIALGRDRHTDVEAAENWAELAVGAVGARACARSRELEALAWAVLGNARRRRGNLRRARQAFGRCRDLRWQIADPLELADTLSLEASYWTQVREFAAAANLVAQARALAAPHADADCLMKYQAQAGMIATAAGHWREALAVLLPVVERVDPVGSPTLALSAAHNLAAACLGSGRIAVARRVLTEMEEAYQRHGDRGLRLQREWLLGRAALAEGAVGEAEARLRTVRDGYLEAGLPYDAALLEIELGELAAARDDWRAVETSGLAAAAALHAAGSPQEAVAAAGMVAEVARRQGSTSILLRLLETARRLTRLRDLD